LAHRAVAPEPRSAYQSFNLFEHKTVLENVVFAPCQLRHEPEEEARKVGLALLRKVGLAEKADVYPSSLSGGQKQRVAIYIMNNNK
jgi:ABC-type polar amino acid transport system ATPase subunit